MKSAARLYAVQALYQMEQSGQTVEAIVKEFLDWRFGEQFEDWEMQEGDSGLFRRCLRLSQQSLLQAHPR